MSHGLNILWFRRNLRLHDNPSLQSVIQNPQNVFPIYIFDTQFHNYSLKRSLHHYGFLLECLEDLKGNLKEAGGELHIFKGSPISVFRHLHSLYKISTVSVQQDCEPIWQLRNLEIQNLSVELNFEYQEHVSHTLWDPLCLISANGGIAPLTFNSFVRVASSIQEPSRPVPNIDWGLVNFFEPPVECPIKSPHFTFYEGIPPLLDLDVEPLPEKMHKRIIRGGETTALKNLAARLEIERAAFEVGLFQPNQARPNLLGPPMSLSAAINVGALSIRYFYWEIRRLYDEITHGTRPPLIEITGQLLWREYFYTLGRLNLHFSQIKDNTICLPIPWDEDENLLQKWKSGKTGYPFIDAGLRQILQEGWAHHLIRNAVAVFLTRGDLWLSWEHGCKHLMENLIDSDWCINAGNWMWISSSAFDRILDCSQCIDPVLFGKRLEPSGEYIRKYVPELANFSFQYIHEPWKAPIEIQKAASCIIGIDYPQPVVNHHEQSLRNKERMLKFKEELAGNIPLHCYASATEFPCLYQLPNLHLPMEASGSAFEVEENL